MRHGWHSVRHYPNNNSEGKTGPSLPRQAIKPHIHQSLHPKRFSTAARALGVRVLELEASPNKCVTKIKFEPVQVQNALRVDDALKAFVFLHHVIFCDLLLRYKDTRRERVQKAVLMSTNIRACMPGNRHVLYPHDATRLQNYTRVEYMNIGASRVSARK